VIIQDYIIKEILRTFSGVFIVLSLIILSTQLLKALSSVANGQISIDFLFSLIAYKNIESLTLLLPLTLFISILLALTRIYKDSEMIALSSCGIGPLSLLKSVSIVVSSFIFLEIALAISLGPWASGHIQIAKETFKTQEIVELIVAGQFNFSNDLKRVLYTEKFNDKKTSLENVFLYIDKDDANNNNKDKKNEDMGNSSVLASEKASLVVDPKNGSRYIVFNNGHRYDGIPGSIDYTDQLTQSEAVLYCSDLSLANQSDWRLPDIKTLYSLIDFSGEDVSSYAGSNTSTLNPFIDTHYFDFVYGNTDAGERIIDVQYASSTLYTSTTMNGDETMFGVNMADGRIKGYGISLRGSEKTFSVQCVRDNSNYAQNNFIDNLDDTVSDMAASLMWQKNDSLVSYDWDEAINYCENNNLAGYSDWRLPNAKELQSLVDYTRSPDTSQSPAINAVFNSTAIINEAGEQDWGYYWSSTTHLNASGVGDNAAYVSFGRAMGYMNNQWMDVHGAGAQRSNYKVAQSRLDPSYQTVIDKNGNETITHGPQGDVVRVDNYVRCVR